MFKTLKNKISLMYMCLVAVIVLIGTLAALSLFTLSHNINDKANNTVQNSMYLIIIVSAIGALGGLLSSRYFIKKLMRPIYELTSSIKKVGEGDVDHEINVSSKDEIGILANEFNKMLERLRNYQQSNMGKLMTEKNKSLAILKSISEPILILDVNYRILLINKACEEFFNISEWKVTGRNINEVIKNDELLSHISSVLCEKEPSKEKIIPFKCTDEDFYFNVIVTKIREDSNKHLKSFVVVFHDVTRLKYLEKVRTDFIATISHEFKTPLTSILMGTSLLRDESVGCLNERQKKIIAAVCEDGERLTALVNNLLQLSRLESGKEVYNFETTSLNDAVETALKSMNSMIEQNNIKVYSHIKKNLPSIKADPEKITWVINNLLSNALKYTGPNDEIHIYTYTRDEEVFLSVKDTGAGIPQEYLDKIFDKYVQVKGYGIEVRGNGLGLAIVKDIIKAHGGSIWCESKPNKGSNFIFSLPICK